MDVMRVWDNNLITSQTRVKPISLIHHRTMRMVRWCVRLTRLTLVCKVIRYRSVQVRQNLKKKKKKTSRVGGPQSPFLYLFLFHSLLRLILSQNKNNNLSSILHQALQSLTFFFLLPLFSQCSRTAISPFWTAGFIPAAIRACAARLLRFSSNSCWIRLIRSASWR